MLAVYPNFMIDGNLSPERLLLHDVGEVSKSPPELQEHLRVWSIPEYHNPALVHHYRTVQPSADADGHMGIVPTLCDTMLTERNKVKAQMEAENKKPKGERDQTLADNLDAVQNGYKIVANSAYGLLGALNSASPIACRPLARIITFSGRGGILTIKRHVERWKDLNDAVKLTVIGGDTVRTHSFTAPTLCLL